MTSSGLGSLGTNRTTYEFDYYSGSQIGIYIGDLLIDDVDSIQYSVAQTKRPIYGYASQYWHTVADGQVLVEGVFSIPFKEADYIIAALHKYAEDHAPISYLKSDIPNTPIVGTSAPRDYDVKRENIERRMMNAATKGIPDHQLYTDLASLPDEAFEAAAEAFEDILWQSPEQDFLTGNLSKSSRSLYGDAPGTHRRADQYPSVDIYILYGDIANAAANHTIKKLIDVSIIGEGQAITVGGQPIGEQYRFIAQNLA